MTTDSRKTDEWDMDWQWVIRGGQVSAVEKMWELEELRPVVQIDLECIHYADVGGATVGAQLQTMYVDPLLAIELGSQLMHWGNTQLAEDTEQEQERGKFPS